MFQIGYLVTAPLIGVAMNRIGRKNCIVIGFTAVLFATIAFGLMSELKNK